MVDGQDDDCGDASESDAWHGLFRFSDEERAAVWAHSADYRGVALYGAILTIDNQGFVNCRVYTNAAACEQRWADLEAAYADDDADDEGDA